MEGNGNRVRFIAFLCEMAEKYIPKNQESNAQPAGEQENKKKAS